MLSHSIKLVDAYVSFKQRWVGVSTTTQTETIDKNHYFLALGICVSMGKPDKLERHKQQKLKFIKWAHHMQKDSWFYLVRVKSY